jgi:glycosyltransferase involved in cell wall biosynthesis
MEALATGLPIITLNHQGARTFLPDAAAIKVSVESPAVATAAMARAVEYVYDHPEARRAMGRAGYEFALRQTWPQRLDRLLAMLHNLDLAPAKLSAAPARRRALPLSRLRRRKRHSAGARL